MIETKWHVSSIAYAATEEEVEKLFADLGKVGRVYLARHSDGKLKGFGFVELLLYRDEQSSRVEAYGRKLHGRAVKVSLAHRDTRAA